MKVKFAAAALFLAAAAAPAAVDAFLTFITLPQAVRLADGSVLPAGKYEVKIDYKGFGNAAEFSFFTGGVFKGQTKAEARGFPAQAPAVASDESPKEQKADQKAYTVKLDPAAQKGDVSAQKVTSEHFPKVEDKWQPAGAANAMGWDRWGFKAGSHGTAVPVGPSVKVSFDSSNSSAGFSALLPAVRGAK